MSGTHYLCWLMNQAQIDAGGPEGYSHLCEVLQSFYFVSLVPMDENRGEEGRGLREEWADTDGGDLYDLEKNIVPYSCTMMELIVVMARRMHFEMLDSQFEAGIGKWSREILENAGLATFRNDIFEMDPEYNTNKIRKILSDIVYRRYLPNGKGGLFPLNWPESDRRHVELLNQMNDYIAENYDIC